MYTVKAVAILDNDGERVVAKVSIHIKNICAVVSELGPSLRGV